MLRTAENSPRSAREVHAATSFYLWQTPRCQYNSLTPGWAKRTNNSTAWRICKIKAKVAQKPEKWAVGNLSADRQIYYLPQNLSHSLPMWAVGIFNSFKMSVCDTLMPNQLCKCSEKVVKYAGACRTISFARSTTKGTTPRPANNVLNTKPNNIAPVASPRRQPRCQKKHGSQTVQAQMTKREQQNKRNQPRNLVTKNMVNAITSTETMTVATSRGIHSGIGLVVVLPLCGHYGHCTLFSSNARKWDNTSTAKNCYTAKKKRFFNTIYGWRNFECK